MMSLSAEIGEAIKNFDEFEKEGLAKAVKFLTQDPSISDAVLLSLRSQVSATDLFQPLFEWLFKLVQLKSASNEVFYFSLQFVPELVMVYLHAVYEDQTLLKANAEAILAAILLEIEKEKPQDLLQVPTLSKPSIYHQCPSQLSQPVLTEAVLQLHNEVVSVPRHKPFPGKSITVNNRLHFLSVAVDVFCDYIMVFSAATRIAFCQSCIRLALQGMGTLGSKLEPFRVCLPESYEKFVSMKRISISDDLITSLLRGIRMCLFQSCHTLATQALQALTIRAEYELLTNSIQISHTLSRLAENVKPEELGLDAAKHMSYFGPGSPDFTGSPADVHVSLNSFILGHNLFKSEQTSHSFITQDSPIKHTSKTTTV